ncbi:MAG: DUF177 domain-containing protein [Acidimicrobiia bacterium]
MSGFRIDVADLLSHPGSRRELTLAEPVADLVGSAARVEGPVRLDLALERISEGIVARGMVTAHWQAECSLCLGDVERSLEAHVDELFEPTPVEGETYPIQGHEIDLEQLVRDVVLLDLPLAPHCEPECVGALPEINDDDDPTDPRWAALSELEL